MKKIICLAVSLLALNLLPVFGQPHTAGNWALSVDNSASSAPALTKFNLDFPGGTPKELVDAIEKATGKPLNVIIPDVGADTKLPSLKMENVDAVQLFAALGPASPRTEYRITQRYGGLYGGGSYTTVNVSYEFRTDGNASDNSIWYFHVDNPPQPPDISSPTPAPVKVCRYYQLAPFLNNGLTVDDITTAIQTGWKMEGADPLPELNYHKETKLLIAYGDPEKLAVVENVLQALQPSVSVFQQRLQNIINTSQPGVPRPPVSMPYGQSGGNSSLSPEAQTQLIEKNRQANSGSSNSVPRMPAVNSNQ